MLLAVSVRTERRGPPPAVLALGGYVAITVVLFGFHVIPHMTTVEPRDFSHRVAVPLHHHARAAASYTPLARPSKIVASTEPRWRGDDEAQQDGHPERGGRLRESCLSVKAPARPA